MNCAQALMKTLVDAGVEVFYSKSGTSEMHFLAALDSAAVPAGRIYTVADIAADPHYQARDMIQQVQMEDGTSLSVPGIIPKLSRTPGSHRRNAPTIGQDTDAVLSEMGLTPKQIQTLKDKGVVA